MDRVAKPEDEHEVAELVVRGPSGVLEIYDRHAGAVYALALRLIGNVETAEQVVEGTFLALWRDRQEILLQGRDVRSYLYSEPLRSWADNPAAGELAAPATGRPRRDRPSMDRALSR